MTRHNRLTRIGLIAQRYQLLLFLALVLARGVMFTLVIPPWQHPDEPTHFEHIRMIAESGKLPAPSDVSLPIRKEIAASMYLYKFWVGIPQPSLGDQALSTVGTSPLGVYTLTQPRLYYIVAAVWLHPWLGQPVETQLYVVRLLSVLLSLVVVTCGYWVARTQFSSNPLMATAVGAFLVFLPGYTDIMAAVNNDALVNAVAACFILLIALALRRGTHVFVSLLLIVLSAGILAIGMATKATALGLVLAFPLMWVVVGAIWALLIARLHKALRLAVLALVAAVLAGIGFAVVAILGPMRGQFTSVLDWLSVYLRADLNGTIANVLGLTPQKVSYALASDIVFRSFWAIFGWRHIYIGLGWYWLPGILTLAAIAGLIIQSVGMIVRIRKDNRDEGRRHTILFIASAFVVLAVAWEMAILRSQAEQGMRAYPSHGRYAYVALIPFALLFAQGTLGLVRPAWRNRATLFFVVGMAAFDTLCFWGYLFPYYYR
jgi:hypothetical protein